MKDFLYTIWDIAEVIAIALIAVVAIKYFVMQPFIVDGSSMQPNFQNGNYLIVDELSYRFKDPVRGDVIVFHSPQKYSIFFIKRIIGLPNEKVKINNNNITIYNKSHPKGFVLNEPYIHNDNRTWIGNLSVNLNNNQYFVMGDNRLNSYDSRYFGPILRNRIVGVVKLRLWPLSEIKLFSTHKYVVN